MYISSKTKKILKIVGLVCFILVLTGCTSNLDANQQLIPERAITESTPWTLDVGLFDFLLVFPIAKSIIFASNILGNAAFGVVAITIIVNLLTLPIMIKSNISQQKIQLIQPEIEKIQRKYKGRKDQQSQMRQNAEIQNVYKKNNVSMFSSFTMLITLPIMLAMWQGVQRIDILYTTTVFGINLGSPMMEHVFAFEIPYIVLLVLVTATQFFSMEITQIMARRNPRYKVTAQTKQMNTMTRMMTLMVVYFVLIMPAAMSLYYITTNIINICRTLYIQFFHIEKSRKEVDSINKNFLDKK